MDYLYVTLNDMTLYHILSSYIISYQIRLYHIKSYHIILHHILSHHVTSSDSVEQGKGDGMMSPIPHCSTPYLPEDDQDGNCLTFNSTLNGKNRKNSNDDTSNSNRYINSNGNRNGDDRHNDIEYERNNEKCRERGVNRTQNKTGKRSDSQNSEFHFKSDFIDDNENEFQLCGNKMIKDSRLRNSSKSNHQNRNRDQGSSSASKTVALLSVCTSAYQLLSTYRCREVCMLHGCLLLYIIILF